MRNNSAMSLRFSFTARLRGVSSLLSLALTSARLANSRIATSDSPRIAAQCNGIRPRLSFALTFAPWASSSPAISAKPWYAARIRGVLPVLSGRSTSASLDSNNSATSCLLSSVAHFNGVKPSISFPLIFAPLWSPNRKLPASADQVPRVKSAGDGDCGDLRWRVRNSPIVSEMGGSLRIICFAPIQLPGRKACFDIWHGRLGLD